MGIDSPEDLAAASAPPPPAPPVALRVVTTYDGTTRRLDVVLGAEESAWVEGTTTTTFPSARLWPVLREQLPPIELLRARPAGRRAPAPRRPGPGFADECIAHVSIATVVTGSSDDPSQERVIVRTWLVDPTTLWSVEAHPDGTTDVRPAAEGALADLLVWDVTAALEILAGTDRRDGAA